jgi:hypothetical protein
MSRLLDRRPGPHLPARAAARRRADHPPQRGGNDSVPRMERKWAFSWLMKNWRVLTLCGGCVFAGFLLGLLIFGSPWHLPPAWGDIPSWITGLATVGLLIGAIITARYAIKAFRAQAQEISDQADMLQIQSDRLELQERQLEDQRKINQKRDELFDKQIRESEQRTMIIERQQAEGIGLEPGSTTREVPGLDPAADDRAWVAGVANRSPRPIRNVAGRIEAAPGAPVQEASLSGVYADFPPSPLAPPNAPTRALIDPPERPDIPLIRAGETGAFLFPVGARLNQDARTTVRFTDDAGLHWQIDHDLHLQHLDNRDDW